MRKRRTSADGPHRSPAPRPTESRSHGDRLFTAGLPLVERRAVDDYRIVDGEPRCPAALVLLRDAAALDALELRIDRTSPRLSTSQHRAMRDRDRLREFVQPQDGHSRRGRVQPSALARQSPARPRLEAHHDGEGTQAPEAMRDRLEAMKVKLEGIKAAPEAKPAEYRHPEAA